MPPKRIAEELFGEPWAIQKQWLEKMISIANRETDLKALEAKLGEPLDYAYEATVRDNIAVIPIDGPIFPKANIMSRMSGAASLDLTARDFQQAVDNPDIDKIVLSINSPGGYITGIDEMYSLIQSSPKQVHAHVSGMGASAAYWLAAAASEISMTPTSSVGSIGVVQVHKIDDEDNTIEFVSSVSPRKRLDPKSDEGKDEIMESVNRVAEVFVDNVAQGRGTSPEDVIQNFGQGGMLTGQQAIDAGMADSILTFEELMAKLSGQTTSYGENSMNVEDLKAEHPEVHEAVYQAGEASANTASNETIANLTTANEALQEENEELKTAVSEATEKNEANEGRILNLEKNEAIRSAKAVSSEADNIAAGIIADSTIPANLHPKVRAHVNHEEFVEEGVLDDKAFAAAMKAEVKDWADNFSTAAAPLAGFGSAGEEAVETNQNEETDAAVDSLLGHLNN